MHKIFNILLLSLCCVTTIASAETCPSVYNLKKPNLTGWKFYDSEDGKPLSEQRIAQFKKMAEKFVLAEWDHQKGVIHCYYSNKDGSGLESYAAKSSFVPENPKVWYSVTGSMQCVVSKDKCKFTERKEATTLAGV